MKFAIIKQGNKIQKNPDYIEKVMRKNRKRKRKL